MNTNKTGPTTTAPLKPWVEGRSGGHDPAPQSLGPRADGTGNRVIPAAKKRPARAVLAGWLVVLALSPGVIAPQPAKAEPEFGPCEVEYVLCQFVDNFAGFDEDTSSFICGLDYLYCYTMTHLGETFLTVGNSQNTTTNLPGGYILATNAAGTVAAVTLTVAPYDGTNFLTTSTVTNVTFYAIPKNQLAGYSATNYAQAPWVNLGTGTNNNGFWTLAWTPPVYTNYILAATIADAVNGTLSSVTWARPQLAVPELIVIPSPAAGVANLWLLGSIGHNYTIQTSTDLHQWNDFLTVSNSTGQGQIEDQEATNLPQKFYRALMQ